LIHFYKRCDMSGLMSRPSVLVGGLAVASISGVCLYLLLRREEDWQARRQGGLSSSKQVVIDVKIPKESVGVVIGREGSNIKEIQARTDTRINFKDELETETHRVAGIRGLSEDVSYAEILIHQTIANQPRLERVTMYVPVSTVGRIIGRQGSNIRDIQLVSGCRVDVEREQSAGVSTERKIVLKGTSEQISSAKKMIEETVKDVLSMRNNLVSNRQPRVKTNQPLFLSYQDDVNEEASLSYRGGKQEVLELMGGDNVLEVFVSGVESPTEFYVQKIGPRSVDLDKLTAEMTQFYEEEANRNCPSTLEPGDIVAAKFTDEENYYRAKIVSIEENSYDYNQSTVELFYVDYGDFDDKKDITDVFELKTEYLKLKFQAIKVSLANVKPYPGPAWSSEATDYFCQISHCAMWKILWAKIKEYSQDNVPIVELIDSSQNDRNIGEELINQEFAIRAEN